MNMNITTNPNGVPFRLHVQRKLSDALRQIIPADGFTYDFSGTGEDNKVWRGRSIFDTTVKSPMISILELSEQGKQTLGPEHYPTDDQYKYIQVIMGRVKDDNSNPTDNAHYAMADVKMRIGQLRGRLNMRGDLHNLLDIPREYGRVSNIGTFAGEVRPPKEETKFAFFWLPIWLEVFENPLNIYIPTT